LWSAILSAVFSVAFTIAALLIAPLPEWRGVRAYAQTFKPIDQLSAYPSLFLAATFTVVMACIYIYASEEKKIFGLVGLAFGILYATMATINYSIQLVAVRQSLLSGETAGMEMFPMSQNTHSIFFALMNSYVYMCLAMFFAAFVFEGGRFERWTRWLFFAMGPVALIQLGWSLFDVSSPILLVPMALMWNIGFPVAFAFLAVLFKRAGRVGHGG
jgi:hypothetical protein